MQGGAAKSNAGSASPKREMDFGTNWTTGLEATAEAAPAEAGWPPEGTRSVTMPRVGCTSELAPLRLPVYSGPPLPLPAASHASYIVVADARSSHHVADVIGAEMWRGVRVKNAASACLFIRAAARPVPKIAEADMSGVFDEIMPANQSTLQAVVN